MTISKDLCIFVYLIFSGLDVLLDCTMLLGTSLLKCGFKPGSGVGFDAGPGPAADLPGVLFAVEDCGDLAFFLEGFAFLFVEVDGGDDDVGEVACDFGAGGFAIGDFAFSDSGGGGVLVVVGGPVLDGLRAGPDVGGELVDEGDVALGVEGEAGLGVAGVEGVDELADGGGGVGGGRGG